MKRMNTKVKRPSRKKFRSVKTNPQGIRNKPWPPTWCEENEYTIWVDEAGCGALAGPMYAGGVILLPGFDVEGIHDSKLLKPHERQALYDKLRNDEHVLWHTAASSNVELDTIGKMNGWRKIVTEVVVNLYTQAANRDLKITQVVLDGNIEVDNLPVPCRAVERADSKYAGVGAASIFAKVSRDNYMIEIAPNYPKFEQLFKSGKGYYSTKHGNLIKTGTYTDIHRKSYNPLRSLLTPKILSKRRAKLLKV